jgi:hypothetical protein
MNASSIQAPSQAALDLIDQKLQSGEVDSGPIFMFDSERHLFVFVQVFDGQVNNWRVEPCPSREVFRARVEAHVAAAGLLAASGETAQSMH